MAADLGFTTQLAVSYRFEEDDQDRRIIDRRGVYPTPGLDPRMRCYWIARPE